MGGSWFVVFAWKVCESAAFDEVHYEIGCGFERHENQHCHTHSRIAIATLKQHPSGHDCQVHRNDTCVREEHHYSDVGSAGRLPLAIVEEAADRTLLWEDFGVEEGLELSIEKTGRSRLAGLVLGQMLRFTQHDNRGALPTSRDSA